MQALNLGRNPLTDTGLKDLTGFANLRELYLCETKISDVGLQQLGSLKNLRLLMIFYTHVTKEGVQSLQQTLPGCKIVVWSPLPPTKRF